MKHLVQNKITLLFLLLLGICENAWAGNVVDWIKDAAKTVQNEFTNPWIEGSYQFGDPANPGLNGGITVGYKYSKWIPPWKRRVGREGAKNCIHQFDLDSYSDNGGVNEYMCAQRHDSGTRMKIHKVVCFGGCWHESRILDGAKSQCGFFSDKALVAYDRICTRIASPTDPGYAAAYDSQGRLRGQYVDEYGVTQWDDLVETENGEKVVMLRPKICAYYDPWAFNVDAKVGGLDVFDLIPQNQPFHANTDVQSPIAKIIFSILDMYLTYNYMLYDIAEFFAQSIAISAGADAKDQDIIETVFDVVKAIRAYVKGDPVGYLAQTLQSLRKNYPDRVAEVTQMNRVASPLTVGGYNMCINIPLGTYPPSYCPGTIRYSSLPPVIEAICSTTSTGQLLRSCKHVSQSDYALCSPDDCVVSLTQDNNFIRSSARVSFQQQVPLCGSSKNNCVDLANSVNVAQTISNNDLIAGTNITPYSTIIPFNSAGTYRAVYQLMNSSGTVAVGDLKDYSYIDVPACDGSYQVPQAISSLSNYTSSYCQKLWGVDLGGYTDSLYIDFSSSEQQESGTASIVGYDIIKAQNFAEQVKLSIDLDGDYNKICGIRSDNTSIGCVARPDMPTPSISQCVVNTSTHMSPCVRVNMSQTGAKGTYAAAREIKSAPYSSSTKPDTADAANLGGATFFSYAADSSNLVPPFEFIPNDPRAFSTTVNGVTTVAQDSIYGNYLLSGGATKPADCTNSTDPNCAIYFSGLEYIRGYYIRGGKYYCVSYDEKGCNVKDNPSQCVLASTSATLQGTGSKLLANRLNPVFQSPNLASSQYYSSASTPVYSSTDSTMALRSKIGIENDYPGQSGSMCVLIPDPASCAATTDQSTYKASWPVSVAGNKVTGICSAGYTPIYSDEVARYCLVDANGNASYTANPKGCTACISSVSHSVTPASPYDSNKSVGIVTESAVPETSTTQPEARGDRYINYDVGYIYDPQQNRRIEHAWNINVVLDDKGSASAFSIESIVFNDYLRIFVNGTQITTDNVTSSRGGNFKMYVAGIVPDLPADQNITEYAATTNSLQNINARLQQAMQAGVNNIRFEFSTFWGGEHHVKIRYKPCPHVVYGAVSKFSPISNFDSNNSRGSSRNLASSIDPKVNIFAYTLPKVNNVSNNPITHYWDAYLTLSDNVAKSIVSISDIIFNDKLRVYINNTQITNDSATGTLNGTTVSMYGNADTGDQNYASVYTSASNSMAALNQRLQQYLTPGTNKIRFEITHAGAGNVLGGDSSVIMKYRPKFHSIYGMTHSFSRSDGLTDLPNPETVTETVDQDPRIRSVRYIMPYLDVRPAASRELVWNIDFVLDNEEARRNIWLSSIVFQDGLRISVTNGTPLTTTQITNDNATGTFGGQQVKLYGDTDLINNLNYQNVFTGNDSIDNLNTRLQNALKVGKNTIKVTTKMIALGAVDITLKYIP